MSTVSITEEIRTRDELHDVFIRKLDLPAYYGRNLDALWDMLSGYLELPLTVEWRHFDRTIINLGQEGRALADLLQAAERELGGFRVVRS